MITTKSRQRAPAVPSYSSEHHSQLIWVYCALSSVVNADILLDLSERTSNRAHRGALLDGSDKLYCDSRKSFEQACKEGQLMFCWHGTSVLEVTA